MHDEDDDVVVQRELRFSRKGRSDRATLVVKVGAPYLLNQTDRGVALDAGAAACTVTLQGILADKIEIHGIDLLHALAQAVDIDRYLKGMSAEYDFYWPNGEAYFDESAH